MTAEISRGILGGTLERSPGRIYVRAPEAPTELLSEEFTRKFVKKFTEEFLKKFIENLSEALL